MNKRQIIQLISFILVFLLTGIACEGPMGPQGEQGPPGPVGPAGADGSIIHAGQGAPDETAGSPGDFYLDLTTGNLFGPKMAEGWGAPLNLNGEDGPQGPEGPAGSQGPEGPQGPPGENGEDGSDGEDGQDGEDGEDGSQIYAGNGAPDNSLGKKGDYYLDKINYDLYGPKTDDEWEMPINLQGPQGQQGPAGSADVTSYLFTDLEWMGVARAINIFYDEDFDIPREVQEEGLVLFYVKFDGFAQSWWPVPATFVLILTAEGNEEYSIAAAYGDAGISVLLRNPDGSKIPSDQDVIDLAALRVIVVPPGAVITPKMGPDDLTGLSYEEVTAVLGLHE